MAQHVALLFYPVLGPARVFHRNELGGINYNSYLFRKCTDNLWSFIQKSFQQQSTYRGKRGVYHLPKNPEISVKSEMEQ